MSRADRKAEFFARLDGLLDEYKNIVLVDADNVTSLQMAKIRANLRGHGTLLMGKNTLIRKVIKAKLDERPGLEKLLPYIRYNVGLVFTNKAVKDIREHIESNRVPAAARVGAIAPVDVVVEKGPTTMDPTMTSFLQALAIASKITKGKIEILRDVELLKVGERVGSSEAALLAKLDIKPFTYGLILSYIYEDGMVIEARVLDLTDDDIVGFFVEAVAQATQISLGSGYPTVLSIPFSLAAAFKDVCALSVGTGLEIAATKDVLAYLADPEAFAAANPVEAAPAEAAAAAGGDDDSSSSGSMGFGGMF